MVEPRTYLKHELAVIKSKYRTLESAAEDTRGKLISMRQLIEEYESAIELLMGSDEGE